MFYPNMRENCPVNCALPISYLKRDSSKIEQFGKLINYAVNIIVASKSKFTGRQREFVLNQAETFSVLGNLRYMSARPNNYAKVKTMRFFRSHLRRVFYESENRVNGADNADPECCC